MLARRLAEGHLKIPLVGGSRGAECMSPRSHFSGSSSLFQRAGMVR